MEAQTLNEQARQAGSPAAPHWHGAWEQVLARDPSASFVYAVTSTGIVCRPTCPSRRPALNNVRFFATVADAQQHGFRSCLRCHPADIHPDAGKVQRLCAFLESHHDQQVTLQQLSREAGLSTFATQRLFQRVMGVSPRQHHLGLRRAALREQLSGASQTITESIYSAGYSTSSRAYEAGDDTLGMKPTSFRDGGKGETIEAAFAICPGPDPLGYVLVARTRRGLCHIALGDTPESLEAGLRQRFHRAAIQMQNSSETTSDLEQAVAQVLSQLTEHPTSIDLPMDLRATAFQERVWQALRAIPRGQTRSYLHVARALGQPSASRAVARACASNTLALVIPCHRVIGTTGDLRGYRWGADRKRRLLALESMTK